MVAPLNTIEMAYQCVKEKQWYVDESGTILPLLGDDLTW